MIPLVGEDLPMPSLFSALTLYSYSSPSYTSVLVYVRAVIKSYRKNVTINVISNVSHSDEF